MHARCERVRGQIRARLHTVVSESDAGRERRRVVLHGARQAVVIHGSVQESDDRGELTFGVLFELFVVNHV